MRFAPIFAWTLATAVASPVGEAGLEKRQSACNANNIAYRVLSNLGPQGSVYCNSLLGLTTAITITTVPTPTITVSTPSTTVTLPATALACQGLFPFGKREAEAEPEAEPEAEAAALEKRQGALGLLAAGQITAGCKCLNLAPRTSTSRVTPTPTYQTVLGLATTTCLP